MESQIEELNRKYWDGTSTVEEEAELKRYFMENKSVDAQAKYFEALGRAKAVQGRSEYPHPAMKRTRHFWMAAAATVLIGGAAVSIVWMDQLQKTEDPFVVEDPKEAYEITRNALLIMSDGLNKGAVATTELKKINKAEEVLIKN